VRALGGGPEEILLACSSFDSILRNSRRETKKLPTAVETTMYDCVDPTMPRNVPSAPTM
jgi:hypothetical protein